MSNKVINGCYGFDFLPTQNEVMDLVGMMTVANILYCGGFGSGKTMLLCEIAFQLMVTYPGIRIGVFRKVRATVSDTTYSDFVEYALPKEYIKGKNQEGHNKTKLRIFLKNDSRIQFFGIDDFNKKGSYKFDVILIDEATELIEKDYVMLQGRMRGNIVPLPMMISFCNPGMPGSYLHKMFVINDELPLNEQDKDYAYFSATSFENTHNPKAYRDRLKKWEGTQYYARYVLAMWVAFRGIVYESYNPDKHLIEPFEIPVTWRKFVAVDFGYEHPLVMLWVAQCPVTGRYYVYRQFYKTHVLAQDGAMYAKMIEEKTGEFIEYVTSDHDAENRAQFEKYYRETIPAVKSIKSGVQAVQEKLLDNPEDKKPMIQIFNNKWNDRECFWYGLTETDIVLEEDGNPTCLQDELPLLKWGKDDKPVKDKDDGCDTLKYAIATDKKEREDDNHVQVTTKKSFSRS